MRAQVSSGTRDKDHGSVRLWGRGDDGWQLGCILVDHKLNIGFDGAMRSFTGIQETKDAGSERLDRRMGVHEILANERSRTLNGWLGRAS